MYPFFAFLIKMNTPVSCDLIKMFPVIGCWKSLHGILTNLHVCAGLPLPLLSVILSFSY